MEVAAVLELATESDDSIFRKGRANNLQPNGKPIDVAARHAQARKSAQVRCGNQASTYTLMIWPFRRRLLKRLIGSIGQAEPSRRHEQVNIRENVRERR